VVISNKDRLKVAGEYLKAKRKEKELTLEQVAAMSGGYFSVSIIKQLEKGATARPDIYSIFLYCDLLDIGISECIVIFGIKPFLNEVASKSLI